MSKIEWCDRTWNPTAGCCRVSDGCQNCWAERMANRLAHHPAEKVRGVYGPTVGRGRWTGAVTLRPQELAKPFAWKKPKRIAVQLMGDLFHEIVPNDYIAAVFGVMAAASQHTFLVLTKRAERMERWFRWLDERVRPDCLYSAVEAFGVDVLCVTGEHRGFDNGFPGWPLPNVHLGVSVENQAMANERIPWLLRCPAALRWVSMEPLLGPVDLNSSLGGTRWIGGQRGCGETHRGNGTPECPHEPHHHHDDRCGRGLDWIVVGGESSSGARLCRTDWIRSILAQCKAAEVPCLIKQLGANSDHPGITDPKGGDMDEWPDYLRVRELPG
jgi:protein gp37